MRRAALLLLATALATLPPLPAKAQKGVKFGNATCGQVFQCPASRDSETSRYVLSQIVKQSNGCILSYFGMKREGGFFEESMGLDMSNCLRTKPIQRDAGGRIVTPKCCAAPIERGSPNCQIVCEIYVSQ